MIFIKRKILALSLIICCLVIATCTTVAFITRDGTARNVITSGNVSISIEEWQEHDGELTAYPYSEGLQIMPGRVVSKIVTVKNESASAYIRSRHIVEIKDENGDIMELSREELDSFISVFGTDDNWIFSDGWYYYKLPLEKGESTKALFEAVEFSAVNMDNRYQGCIISLNVEAQAVQAAHNGDDVLKVQGWGE